MTKQPRPGSKVRVRVDGKWIRGIVRNVYRDGLISLAFLEEDVTPDMRRSFSYHPQTKTIHYIAKPDEYEVYGDKSTFH